MKKAMKKLMAALLAVAMVCAMAIPAWAADGTTTASTTNTLTIHGSTTGRAYEAYQVFKGKLNSSGVLSDIQWGDGVKGDDILADSSNLPASLQGATTPAELAAKLEAVTAAADVDAFAKVVGNHLSAVKYNSAVSTGTDYTIGGLTDGYYFIKESTTSTLPEGATYSRYMLSILKDETINTKDTSVTLNKQIYHNDTDSWGVVGDNQIGDTVKFRTITTVPDVTGYTSYTYKIHDTMSNELTSNVNSKDDITIKINNDDSTILDSQYYEVDVSGNTFTVTVKIIEAVKAGVIDGDDELYTYYSGVLNESAKIYDEGNQDNEAYLEYSNNPTDGGTGNTPKKKVYDWTFKVDVTKVDGQTPTKTLEGAVFVLSDSKDLKLATDENGNPTDTSNLIPLVAGSNGVYTVSKTSTAYTMTTPVGGKISIKGLDDHKEYYLYETKAPDGYNTLTEPVKFKVNQLDDNAYENGGAEIKKSNMPTVKVNGTDSASVAFDVKNNHGTTLPGTGGIGTTIFYVVGGGLMVAAAVLLITKKRMENH